MSPAQEIKSCPFCGGEAVKNQRIMGSYTITHADNCYECSPNSGGRLLLEEAVAAWNRRPAPARVSNEELIERLQAILESPHAQTDFVSVPIDRAISALASAADGCEEFKTLAAEAIARAMIAEALLEDARPYITHKWLCASREIEWRGQKHPDERKPCDCGFVEAVGGPLPPPYKPVEGT